MVVEIPLTQGYVALVDDDVAETICIQAKWCYNHGYAFGRLQGENIYLHLAILGERPPGMVADHINRNKLDNRRENLRWATKSQNGANAVSRSNRSGYRGVHQKRGSKKFQAIITLHLGTFDTPEEAALAYDDKARDLWGEFAQTNF
jgi:hypothetical protein